MTTAQDTTALWEEYWDTGNIECRNALVERYMPFVYKIAHRLKSSSCITISLGDLISSGSMGLLNAVERFSREATTNFLTFAKKRIRGEMLDDIRDGSWVPRSVFIKRNEILEAEKDLQKSLDRPPLNCELAEYLNIDTDTLLRWLQDIAFPVMYRVDEWRYKDTTITWGDCIPDDRAETGFQFACRRELEAWVEELLQTLDERELYVVKQVYFERRKKQLVAEDLGVCPSRISQILRVCLQKLRFEMERFLKLLRG